MIYPERYYPSEICIPCGQKYGRPWRPERIIGTWQGKCEWCGGAGEVASPRDFLFPEWQKPTNSSTN